MASTVNRKFVIGLTAGLIALFGMVAGGYLFIKLRSGERHVARGDEAMARSDFDSADAFYAKAVGRQQANVEWLAKWRSAREKMVPTTFTAYNDAYGMYSRGILRQLAQVKRTDVAAHEEYLGEIYRFCVEGGGSRQRWQELADEADKALKYMEPEAPASIRRLRGMALANLFRLDPKLDAALRDQARGDLEASLKERPDDAAAAGELVSWHATMGESLRAQNKNDEADAAERAARATVDALAAAGPRSFDAQLTRAIADASDAERKIPREAPPAEQLRRRSELSKQFVGRLEELVALAKASDAKLLAPSSVDRFLGFAGRVDPRRGPELSSELLAHALTARPNDALLLIMRATSTQRSGDLDAAVEQLQRVVDLPNLPVSFDGWRLYGLRTRARFEQAHIVIMQAMGAKDEKSREAAMARAREVRKQLALEVPEDSAMLQYIDGRLAFAANDLSRTQELLSKFLRTPGEAAGRVPDAMVTLADAAQRSGQPGRARDLLERLNELVPGSVDVMLAWARVELQLQNRSRATVILTRVLELDPGNADARQMSALASGDPNALQDPALRALAEAERVARPGQGKIGDENKAIEMLEAALVANKYDVRLVQAIVSLRLARGEKEKALDVATRASAAKPEDEPLKRLVSQIRASSSLTEMLALIDQSPSGPLEKALARVEVHERMGNAADAEAALAEAAKVAPEDPRVIERQFVGFMAKSDAEGATKLAEVAARTNADAAGGDTYKARLALLRNDLREAASLLQRVVERGNAPVAAHRLLGQVELMRGRVPEGLAAYQAALALNPADLPSIKGYISALVQNDRMADALAVARQSEVHARYDREFINAWLALESEVGNVAFARERREQVLANSPDDASNLGALAELYMLERSWDKARGLVDRLKQQSPGLRVVVLEARWHADQGNLRAARQAFLDHIEAEKKKPDAKPSPDAYIALGQFLIEREQLAAGLQALELAREYQNPKVMGVDMLMGDIQLQRGLYGGAEKAYKNIIDAGVADPKFTVRKRYVETLLQQDRFAEADSQLAALGEAADEDVEVMLQRASAARGLGDVRRAREALDKAVQRFPDQPMPYVRRARLAMTEPDQIRDALDDLSTALRLRPTLVQALKTRASIFLSQNRPADAVKDLRACVEANPMLDSLRFELIRVLVRSGQEAEAVTVAEAGLKLKPNNVAYIRGVGDTFAGLELWPRAARFYKELFEAAPEQGAPPYAMALLRSPSPSALELDALARTNKLKFEGSVVNLLVRAALRQAQKRDADAAADVRASLALVPVDARGMIGWFVAIRTVFPDTPRVLSAIRDVRADALASAWLTFFRAQLQTEAEATRSQAIQSLRQLVRDTADPALKVESLRVISMAYMADSKWAEALEACQEGLKLVPDDVMFNNNAANFLAQNLGRPKEALEYAQRAARNGSEDPNVLDSVAATHWAAGDREKAIETLRQALNAYRTDVDRCRTYLKLARWHAESGDRARAAAIFSQVREYMVDEPSLRDTLKQPFDETAKILQAP